MGKSQAGITHFLHKHLLLFVLAMYVLAAFLPTPLSSSTLSMVLLSFLIFNSAFALNTTELWLALKQPKMLFMGIAINILVPLLFGVVLSLSSSLWHNHDEVQNILVAIAIMASMPIAGSSTAWSQTAGGSTAISLGLIVLSTALSPITTPLVFHFMGIFTTGDYSEDLHEIAAQGATTFLFLSVVIPCAVGILSKKLAPARVASTLAPRFRFMGILVLLYLNYSNAALTLPKVIAKPDYDFLALIFLLMTTLCVAAFVVGWRFPALFKAKPDSKISFMYGIGMNNNGAGLILVASALADHTDILIPILAYNLVQQIGAGVADAFVQRRTRVVA